MNEEFLNRFRKAPRREFSAALYQRITQSRNLDPMKTRTRMLLRAGATALTLLAVLAAVLVFSEPTRALADSVIRQIGGFIFVQGSPTPDPKKQALLNEKPVDKPVEPKAADEAGLPAQKVAEPNNSPAQTAPDAASASPLVGFTVLAPGYIPAGYSPSLAKTSGGWVIEPQRKGAIAAIAYENPSAKGFFSIQEVRTNASQPPQTFARPEIIDVTVRGQAGVWMPVEEGKNALVWEENGVTFSLVSNVLPLDELKKVAESLK